LLACESLCDCVGQQFASLVLKPINKSAEKEAKDPGPDPSPTTNKGRPRQIYHFLNSLIRYMHDT